MVFGQQDRRPRRQGGRAPDSFFTIPHFDGYRAVLIRLPQVTGMALREAITDGWLACAPPGSPGIFSPAGQSAVVSPDRAS